MFSIYGKAGQMFRGTMEELRKVGPTTALSRARRVYPIGQGSSGEQYTDYRNAAYVAPADISHKSALAAYAQTTKDDAPRHPLTQVSDIMSRTVITILDTFTVGEAWELIAHKDLGQAPVVNAEGMLVGLLTRADLMRRDRLPGPESHALAWRAMLAQSVTVVMWTPVPSVSADADIRRVARVLLDTSLPGLPVVDEQGLVVGFVSRSDILRAVVADPPLDLWT
jgi:CBS-domain-containing membrane protein